MSIFHLIIFAVCSRFKYGVVNEEHVDAVMDFLDFDKIVRRLAERDHLELQFKRVKKFDVLHKKSEQRDYEWCSIAVTITDRDSDGKPLTFTMAIRGSGRADLANIPIIAMTADAFADDVKKAKEAGMNDHIAKPVDIEKLGNALNKWVE